ncbi:MAG: hypothetical protein HXY43_13440 [Fischerella sp.]|jgi:hypothetical protein|uniref:hypothetical protein n=1 Tax=Fischerella sp. TaxID=1191 RepID=UPI0017B35C01|nr:hypothetical protein [Fischerella sp.]NWF60230.1 hypothetical protein [Fischerella sp.]
MRAVNGSFYNHKSPSTNTQTYSPSVPLSVYRDLAAELQAAQAKIDTLIAQNHQLAQENQLLRQEITKTVQSVLHLQNLLDPSTPARYQQVPQRQEPVDTQPPPQASRRQEGAGGRGQKQKTGGAPRQQPPRRRPPVIYTEMEFPVPMTEPVFVEEQQVVAYPVSESEAEGINAWWMFLAIAFIILLGFGAGYLVVRPLFEHHTR